MKIWDLKSKKVVQDLKPEMPTNKKTRSVSFFFLGPWFLSCVQFCSVYVGSAVQL